jgi:hypothetical protein
LFNELKGRHNRKNIRKYGIYFLKKNLLKDAFLRNLKFLELIKFIGIFDDVHFRHCFMTFVSVFENPPNNLLSGSLNEVSIKLGFKVVTVRLYVLP